MPVDSTKKTIGVAIAVSLVCSVLVSLAAVSLNPIQKRNKKLDRLENILVAGELLIDKARIEQTYRDRIVPVIIKLETGERLPEEKYNEVLNVEDFDIRKVAEDAVYGRAVPPEHDIAQIKRMPRYMTVYLVKEDGETSKIILPVYGRGLWSTLYGFMALDRDLKTIKGVTFYEHGETPGLGGEVDNPRWKKTWKGKHAFDDDWNVRIKVIKGRVDTSKPDSKYKVDGISGATITTRGVDNLVRFWLGPNGYGPFIKKLRGDWTDG